jgi:hypothetical protein
MSFKHIDMESALRRLAERRIEEAMREGKFDNLAGAGKPLELEPMPADEDARLAWWALRLMKQNDFTPEEIRWRKQLDRYRDDLAAATSESNVKALVAAHNQLVRQINTMGTNALKSAVAPLSLEAELRKLWERIMPPKEKVPPVAQPARVCPGDACRCPNPHTALFCRRCGGALV